MAEPIRYFRPEAPGAEARAPSATAAIEGAPLALRIRHVGSAAELKEKIAHRVSSFELAFSENARWTEPPIAFVERALGRELFEARGIERSDSGSAPHLDVELRAFEEAWDWAQHAYRTMPDSLTPRPREEPDALIVVWVSLSDAHDGRLLERTFVAREPIRGDVAMMAGAMGSALEACARDIASAVETALRKARTAAPPK